MQLSKQIFDKRDFYSFKRFKWTHTLLFSFVLIGIFSFVPHPYHVSYTEIFYKKDAHQLTFSVEVFTDDLELALKLDSKSETIYLGTSPVSDSTEILIQKYLSKNISVIIDGIVLRQLTFLPTESNPDRTTIYFEIIDLPNFKSFAFYNEILINTLPDQQNIIEFNHSGKKEKVLFDKGKTSETWIVD